MRKALWAVGPALLLAGAVPAGAVTIGGFGPGGQIRPATTDGVVLGSGGDVFQLDAFVTLAGSDLNGAGPGSAARVGTDPLPAGLGSGFTFELQDGATDLLLRYELRNDTGGPLPGLGFVSYLDAEIDEALNTFFNEFAEVTGTLAAGQSFEVDEPGFAFGDLFANARTGALDGTNAVPASSPEDVAMALGFEVPTLGDGEIAELRILLSEDGDRLGSFALVQRDADARSLDAITYSGELLVQAVDPGTAAPIPEPRAALLFAVGLVLVRGAMRRGRRRAPSTSGARPSCSHRDRPALQTGDGARGAR